MCEKRFMMPFLESERGSEMTRRSVSKSNWWTFFISLYKSKFNLSYCHNSLTFLSDSCMFMGDVLPVLFKFMVLEDWTPGVCEVLR